MGTNGRRKNIRSRSVLLLGLFMTMGRVGVAQNLDDKLIGSFVSLKSDQYTLDLRQMGDSLLGNHCFTSRNGNRVDCCPQSEGYSLHLKRTRAQTFEGSLADCYEGETHSVTIVRRGENIVLAFTEEPHPFAPDTLEFRHMQTSGTKALSKSSAVERTQLSSSSVDSTDRVLNDVYRQVMRRYAGMPTRLLQLKTAQRAWLGFRDAQLALDNPSCVGSNNEIVSRTSCYDGELRTLTVSRITELSRLLSGQEPPGCRPGR
jgi:uncharacterized protein YecT (DUF1311 family)